MKSFRFLLCFIFALGLLFSGCQRSRIPAESSVPTITPNASVEASSVPPTISTFPVHTFPGNRIPFANPGSLRIAYTTDRSSVQYISDPSQLPDYPAFGGYDADFFKEHALLLVTDTVGSGSTEISIDSLITDGDTASVTLRRVLPGDVGTADMATWLLWVEVPTGLNLTWEIANPALSESDSSEMHTS